MSAGGATSCAVSAEIRQEGTVQADNRGDRYVEGPNGSWGGNADNGSWDGGSFSYYAGPVYTYAPHECAYWGGDDGAVSEDLGPDFCN